MGYRLGIDVGGTFTDFALYDEASGRLEIRKVLSTPRDPSLAVLAGVDELIDDLGIRGADVTEAIHATTVATNTVIQRNGPQTALITTEGFRDVLIIGRQKRWELYDNYTDKPVPVLPRERIWAVRERMLHDGTVRTKLDERAVRRGGRAGRGDLFPPFVRQSRARAARGRDRPRGSAGIAGDAVLRSLAGLS